MCSARRFTTIVFVLTAIGLVLATSVSLAQVNGEWYETEGSTCSGDATLGGEMLAFLGVNLPLRRTDGNVFVELNAAEIPAREKIDHVTTLDGESAAMLKHEFESVAENSKVPTFAGVGTSVVTGLALPPALGTAVGLVFSYLFSLANVQRENMRDASLFVVTGGEVYTRRALIVRKSDLNPFLFLSVEYSVSVGSEERHFMTRACIYPIVASVKEFHTTGPLNNKVIKAMGGSQWRQWDVDGSKFEGDPYLYTKQFAGYFYFERNRIEEGSVVGKDLYRISFLGGPFQLFDREGGGNGSWKTLYASVTAQ